ncbi:MAG: Ig-like domain-containing protein [Phycisphaerae bacterium]
MNNTVKSTTKLLVIVVMACVLFLADGTKAFGQDNISQILTLLQTLPQDQQDALINQFAGTTSGTSTTGTTTTTGTGSTGLPLGKDAINFVRFTNSPALQVNAARAGTPILLGTMFTVPEEQPDFYDRVKTVFFQSLAQALTNILHLDTSTTPVANSMSVSATSGQATSITLTGSDPNNHAITFRIVTTPTHGTVSGTAPNITYTSVDNFTGSDNFTFLVNNGTKDSVTATVTLAVSAANTTPVANAQSITVASGLPAAITLTGSDADNNTLTYSIATNPANGTLTGTPPNVTYTSTVGFSGSDNFTFKVNDGIVNSAPATISITVTP